MKNIVPPPPPPSIDPNLPIFELDLAELNSKLCLGFLKKRKNEKSKHVVVKCRVNIKMTTKPPITPSQLRLVTLGLSLTSFFKKKSHQKKTSYYTWSKEFAILNPTQTKTGVQGHSEIQFSTTEVYEKVFKELSKNTHISDEERKIPFLFSVRYLRSTKEKSQMITVSLDHHKSTRFFICGWRKGMRLEKERKLRESRKDFSKRFLQHSRLIGVHPSVGTVVQPVSVYVRTSDGNIKDFMNIIDSYLSKNKDDAETGRNLEDLVCVYFGDVKAHVMCSVNKELIHPMFKNSLRIVCLTPLSNMIGNILISVNINVNMTNEKARLKEMNKLQGSAVFSFLADSNATTTITNQQNVTSLPSLLQQTTGNFLPSFQDINQVINQSNLMENEEQIRRKRRKLNHQ